MRPASALRLSSRRRTHLIRGALEVGRQSGSLPSGFVSNAGGVWGSTLRTGDVEKRSGGCQEPVIVRCKGPGGEERGLGNSPVKLPRPMS